MGQVIRIPENLYRRLSFHAKGFETPANVIEKMLNFYEEKKVLNLQLILRQPVTLLILWK